MKAEWFENLITTQDKAIPSIHRRHCEGDASRFQGESKFTTFDIFVRRELYRGLMIKSDHSWIERE